MSVRPVTLVIGAGVLGAAVAARLADAGARVTLLDRDQPGRAASRWSFAWVNSNDKGPRPYHELNHAGIRAWAGLAPDLDGPAWYRPAGNLELASDDAARAGLAARVRRLTEWGYPARLIDAAEAGQIEPALRAADPGAWFPEEAYLLTEPLIARLVAYATSRGAVLLAGEQGRVVGFGTSPTRVRTAAGDVLEADEVVCCAGRWVPELAALAGATAPVPLVGWAEPGATAPGFVVRIGPVAAEGPRRVLHAPDICLRPHEGRLAHLEAPDAAVDLHTPEAELRRWAGELLGRARRTVRGLDDARVVEYKVCVRPMPADGQSVVGRLPGADWLYVAVTHSGVTLAAHLSRLIAAELTSGAPAAELAPFRPARFAVGHAPNPDPHLLTRVISAARIAVDDTPAGSDPQTLTPLQAVAVVRSLARVVEEGMREAVQRARQAGHTWAEIGDLLGTTRQAAFQRFGRPLDPGTGAPMADAIPPGAPERASAMFADLTEQRWDQVVAGFNQQMSERLGTDALAAVWAQVIGTAGAYRGMGEAVAHQAGDYTVVDVPLHFEAADLTGRVSYTRIGQVAGLFFLNPQ